jgi:hypothetical protein
MILRALALVAVYALATTVGPTSDTSINDLYVYSVYADAVHQGLRPFIDFGFEYPPLALYPIVLSDGDPWRLAIGMLGCLLVTQWCCERLAGPQAGWVMALSPLLVGAMVRTHFDALPAALALAGLLAIATGAGDGAPRPLRRDLLTPIGFFLLALGGMVKLWPLALVGVAVVWLWARGQRSAAVLGVVLTAVVSLAILAPFPRGGLRDAVRFHQDRPVQIESTPATVLYVLGRSSVTGDPVRPDVYKSNGLAGGGAHTVEVLFQLLQVLALLAAFALAARGGRDVRQLVLCSMLAVVAFVALGKVLSPQYLVWLMPFAALAWAWGARGPALLTLAAAVVTQLEFPSRYFHLLTGDGTTFAIVGLRNALLVAAGISLAAAAARSPSPGSVPPAPRLPRTSPALP